MTKALASRGYNITVLSPDLEVSYTNVHYIHAEKVYEVLYNSQPEEEINFVEVGDQNAFKQIIEFSKFSILMCVGHIKSEGWKQLEQYPNDFKVIK